MKLLPCRGCKGPAMASKTEPHAIGRLTVPELTYKCQKCGTTQTIKPSAFNMLPDSSKEELIELGVPEGFFHEDAS